jgi:hypothetical protein
MDGNPMTSNSSVVGSMTVTSDSLTNLGEPIGITPASYGGDPPGAFGAFQILGPPSHSVSAHLDTDKWIFRLVSLTHEYRMAPLTLDSLFVDLPWPDPVSTPFPLAPDVAYSYQEAELDLTPPSSGGPRRYYYWSSAITMKHEKAHRYQYYHDFWLPTMLEFENNNIEGNGMEVVVDCNDTTTLSGYGAKNSKESTWVSQRNTRHGNAGSDYLAADPEGVAHTESNPPYWDLVAQIPPH